MNRALFVLGVWGMAVAVLIHDCQQARAASPYQACPSTVSFPLNVWFAPDVDRVPWDAAIAEWNMHYPGSFAAPNTGDEYQVAIERGDKTFVTLPCNRVGSVVHVGNDTDIAYWAAHELVHTLGVRDYVPKGTNLTGYVNPGTCPGDYVGIASYCAGRDQWFGPDDDRMMASLGYRWRLRFPL